MLLNSGMLLWAYWRQGNPDDRPFLFFLGANTALSAVLLFSNNTDSVLSFISIGIFVFTVLVPSFLGRIVDRALLNGRYERAYLIHGLREHLQPGRDWGGTKQALTRMLLVQRGQADEVIAELRKLRTDPEAARSIDVEIVNILGLARRWRDVVESFEAHLPDDLPAYHGLLAIRLIRAYGELGRYKDMDRIMSLLEFGPASQTPGAGITMDMARLLYLAYMGQADELSRLLAPDSAFAQNLPDELRLMWIGIAEQHAGRFQEARRRLERVKRRIRSKATKEEIDARLASLEDVTMPPAESPILEQELLQARAKADMPRLQGGYLLRLAPVTVFLVIANIAVYLAMVLAAGHGPTTRDLILSGGNLKAAVLAGQYWRIVTASFLHAHWAHIGLNMLVLLVLGRPAEAILGHGKYLAAYILSAVVSGVATVWIGRQAPLSVGASGAIFGIMGALLSSLYLGRNRWPQAWRKSMLMLLAAMAVLSLLPGLSMKIIDNWAHLGGLAGGLAAGAVLWFLPDRRWFSGLLTVGSLAVILSGWWGYATSQGLPKTTLQVHHIPMHLPASWIHLDTTDEYVSLGDIMTDARMFLSFKTFDTGVTKQQADMLLVGEKQQLEKEAESASIEMKPTGTDLFSRARRFGLSGITLRYAREGRLLDHGLGLAAMGKNLVVVHMACPVEAVESCKASLEDLAESMAAVNPAQSSHR